MRFYSIAITNPDGSPAKVGPFSGKLPQFTSFVDGKTIPGALNVEFDLPTYNWDTPLGGSFVKIWGIGLQDISQAANLNGASISIQAGMQKGLPLANPAQAGLLVNGVIQQAFGNWQGTQQSIDLLIQGNYGTPQTPLNISFNCAKGAPLAVAILNALNTVFPTAQLTVNISAAMILPYDAQPGIYGTLGQFATFINGLSRNINQDATYQGIKITVRNNEILVQDGTTATMPIQISFTDLIGQPTWIAFGTVQSKLVMRGDIQVGDFIQYPPTQVTTLAQSYSQYRDKSAFQGVFQVSQIRNMGNFRQKDANSWVSVVDAVAQNAVTVQ